MTVLQESMNYAFSLSIMCANVMVFFALQKMKYMKKSTLVYFGQLSMSNFVIGLTYLVRTIFISMKMESLLGCQLILIMLYTSILVYVLNLLYLSVELYITMRQMRASSVAGWRWYAVGLSVASWLGSGAACLSGIALRNEEHRNLNFSSCFVTEAVFVPAYINVLTTAFVVILIVITIFYLLTLNLLKKATRIGSVSSSGAASGQDSNVPAARSAELKRLKAHKQHLHTIVAIILLVSLSWGTMSVIIYVFSVCDACGPAITLAQYVIQILFIAPLFGNGIIYLVKIPQFRATFKLLFCTCMKGRAQVMPSSAVESQTQ